MSENSFTAEDILHESKIFPVQWIILMLCMLGSMIEGFDIVIIAYTAPAISADWSVSSGELGMVFSAGVLGMTLGAMMLGGLADRFGRRIVVALSLLIAGLATLAVAFSSTVVELVVLRVIAGLALGALVATLPALVGEFCPRRHRTLFIAILLAAANFGGFAGGLIVAEVIDTQGWQRIFLYTGLLTLLVAILIQLLVPETIAFLSRCGRDDALDLVNRVLSRLGQRTITQLPILEDHQQQERGSVRALLAPRRRSATLLVWSAFFLAFLVVYFISSWMPQVLTGAGLSQQQSIQATTALPLGAIAGNIVIGWLAAWWPLRRLVILAFIIGGGCMAALSSMSSILGSLPFLLIWGILLVTGTFLFGAFGNLYNIAMIIYPAQIRGTGLGWAAGLGRAGAVVSPTLAGLLIAVGLSIPSLFFIFAIPAFLAAICVWFIRMSD